MVQDLVAWKSTSRIYNIKLSFSFFHFPHSKFSNERHRNGKIDSIFPLSFIWRDKTVFQGLIFNIFIVVPCVKIVKKIFLYIIPFTFCQHPVFIHTPIRNVFKRGRGSFSRNERMKEIENANSPTFPRFKKKRTVIKIVLYLKALLSMRC